MENNDNRLFDLCGRVLAQVMAMLSCPSKEVHDDDHLARLHAAWWRRPGLDRPVETPISPLVCMAPLERVADLVRTDAIMDLDIISNIPEDDLIAASTRLRSALRQVSPVVFFARFAIFSPAFSSIRSTEYSRMRLPSGRC